MSFGRVAPSPCNICVGKDVPLQLIAITRSALRAGLENETTDVEVTVPVEY
jgi:hypothetical protein